MSVTAGQVRSRINASAATVSDADINDAINVANELVLNHIGTNEVPSQVIDRATLLVAIEEINQEKAPNGLPNQVFDVGVGEAASTPLRIGRDPMKPAYPLLAPFVGGRFFCA